MHNLDYDDNPPSKLVWYLLLLWLFISSLYYIDTLLTGNFSVDYEEGTHHKIIKYVVCLGFTIYLLIKARKLGMLAVSITVLLTAVLLMLHQGGLALSMLVWVTVGSMGGFVAVLRVWRDRAHALAACIVYSAVVVGIFSMLELTLMSAVLQSYWSSTGSMRSVSTMFNPNNLGMYTGAALILLPFISARRWIKMLLSLPIIFALAASGSRTAWVSLVAVALLMLMFDREVGPHTMRYLRRHGISLFVAGALAAMLIVVVKAEDAGDFESTDRGANLHTADLRVENFITYLHSLDWTILLPDIEGIRSHLIQDSFFLVVLSAFGVIAMILLGVFFLSQHTLYWRADLHNRLWRWVFTFYMISGLSGSFLNSFPNNQLFLISLGAFFVSSVRQRRQDTVLPGVAP